MTESTETGPQGLDVPELCESTPPGERCPHEDVPDLTVVPRRELKALMEVLLDAAERSGQNDTRLSLDQPLLDAAKDFLAAHKDAGLDGDLGLNISGSMAEILAVQTAPGNYDYNDYMHGLANGLILAQSLIVNSTPVFLEQPEVWIADTREADELADTEGTPDQNHPIN